MDGSRFDTLTRSLAAPRSRRGLLGGLAALGAGLLGAQRAGAQVTQVSCGNRLCASNPGGCNPGCVCCVYTNPVTGRVFNSRCRPPGTCSPGTTVCPPGQAAGPSGVCAAPTTTTTTTTAPPDPCASVQCATGQVCANGACRCANDDDHQCSVQCFGSVFATTEGCMICAASGGFPNCSANPETQSPPCVSSADCGPGGFCVSIPTGGCPHMPGASGLCGVHCPVAH